MDFGTRTWIHEIAFLSLIGYCGWYITDESFPTKLYRFAFWAVLVLDILKILDYYL